VIVDFYEMEIVHLKITPVDFLACNKRKKESKANFAFCSIFEPSFQSISLSVHFCLCGEYLLGLFLLLLHESDNHT
jgi:hypothetical protein